MTAVIILPQRQTALVAKQAATVDVLSGGRLRLGVGIGWNDVEYEALGENFHDRGRRSEEQIEVMRALWTNELVTYEGRWHRINGRGDQSAARATAYPCVAGRRGRSGAATGGPVGGRLVPAGAPR